METSELLSLIIKAAQNLKDEAILGRNSEERKFNNSERRLIGYVVLYSELNKKIISTQLAEKLGVTRSAVSQMINRLEERGVVKRVPSEFDRKVSYIELTDNSLVEYNKQKEKLEETISKISELMGEEDMAEFTRLVTKFIDCKEQVLGKSNCR